MVAPPFTTPTHPEGPITRARVKLLQAKVNTLLSLCDFDSTLDGILLHPNTLCILRYEPREQATKERQEKKPEEKLQEKVGERIGSPEIPPTISGAAPTISGPRRNATVCRKILGLRREFPV